MDTQPDTSTAHQKPERWSAPPAVRQDLTTRSDVDVLVGHFYRDVATGELLHDHFATMAGVNWQAHMLTLGDYWEGFLFTRDHDSGEETIGKHRHLHDELPFTEEMFSRWLELFASVLDRRWAGPNVERLRRHGRGMAWAMARRYVGISLPRGSDRSPTSSTEPSQSQTTTKGNHHGPLRSPRTR